MLIEIQGIYYTCQALVSSKLFYVTIVSPTLIYNYCLETWYLGHKETDHFSPTYLWNLKYRITHKRWDFRDDIVEFIQFFFLHSVPHNFILVLLFAISFNISYKNLIKHKKVSKVLSLCNKLDFLIPISLQPNVVDLKYLKILLDPIIHVWNHQIALRH